MIDELETTKKWLAKTKLKVFYGFTRLTKKAVRKPELAIWFENDTNYKDNFLNQKMLIVHTRKQTKKERSDALHQNRMFVKYGYFIDEKPWNSDIDRILEDNFQHDSNHVSEEERTEIKEKLRKAYYSFYKRKPIIKQQLKLDL